jgi:MFS family permease
VKRPVFAGWRQVAIAMANGAFSTGAGIWAFSVFVQPMGDDLGWSRTEIYGALTVRALVGGALGPVAGPIQDTKLGPRFFAVATTLTMAASMMAMKWVDDLLLFYVVFGGIGALATVGSSEMMLSVVLPRWFVRQRGRALGFASMGTAMGPLVFPLIVTFLLAFLSWRDAWFALGLLTLAVLGPLSLLVRGRPEDVGLLPDGDDTAPALASQEASQRSSPRPALEKSFGSSEVVRLRCFWLLVAAACLSGLGMTAFHANWLPYFQDIGLSRAEGSLAITAYGICGMTSRLLWGRLADRFSVNRLLLLQGCLTGTSVLMFLLIRDPYTMLFAAVCHGLSVGGMLVMRPMLFADYFGRGHLGAVNGIMRPFTTLVSAGGPLLVAWLYDQQGSYSEAFLILAIGWFVAGFAVAISRSPQLTSAKSTTRTAADRSMKERSPAVD